MRTKLDSQKLITVDYKKISGAGHFFSSEFSEIQESIENLKITPRGKEIATWMWLYIYSDKEYIKQRQELEAKKNKDYNFHIMIYL